MKSAQFRGVLAPDGQGHDETKAPILFAGGEDTDDGRRDVQDVAERA